MSDDGMMRLMEERHSVRKYRDQKLDTEHSRDIQNFVDTCNAEGHLYCQFVTDSPEAFSGILSRGFSNVRDYIVLVRKATDSDEKIGYYGEKMVLEAQRIGLNTCWVGLTYSKRRTGVHVTDDRRIVGVIAVGYGENQGVPHKSKPMEELCNCPGEMPEWFRKGMEAVMMAPSAMNRQRFRFTLVDGNTVKAETSGGSFAEMDLGIAKLHFELGAGKENFQWARPGSDGGPGGGLLSKRHRDRMKGAGPSSIPRPTASLPEDRTG